MSAWFASPPPDAAIEIAPEGVSVAALGGRGRDATVHNYATEALAAGLVVPKLTAGNIVDREAVARAVAVALERATLRPRRVALVIPDVAARVSLVRFDRIPDRREDLDQLVRWQVRKAAPFPVDEASLSYAPGIRTSDGGGEFIVVLARQDVIREYESVCEELGLHAGLVDVVTLSVLNLFLASSAPNNDWLAVHMRPDYVSLAIMRGEHMIFFRNRAEGEEEALADVVHQTSMYYQDRLGGEQFVRVLLGGMARTATAFDDARRSIEQRLGVHVESIDPTSIAPLTDRISPSAELRAMLAPLVGILLRAQRETVAA
jgi:type IV pilus assembly protein PilM